MLFRQSNNLYFCIYVYKYFLKYDRYYIYVYNIICITRKLVLLNVQLEMDQ